MQGTPLFAESHKSRHPAQPEDPNNQIPVSSIIDTTHFHPQNTWHRGVVGWLVLQTTQVWQV
jgi:hypothetical protein